MRQKDGERRMDMEVEVGMGSRNRCRCADPDQREYRGTEPDYEWR